MNYTISLTQLRALMVDAGEVAAKKALTEAGLMTDTLNKAQAYKKHGRSDIDRWIKEGLLHPVRDGSGKVKWRIDRLELEAVSKAENRHTFLNTEERKNHTQSNF